MKFLVFLLILLTPIDYLFGESLACPLKWPRSCGVLMPDPGGFPTENKLRPWNAAVNLSEILSNPQEIPEILCRSNGLSSDDAAREIIAGELAKKYQFIADNIAAAIIPTLVTARYKSGVIISIGHGRGYVCFNDRGHRIWYAIPSSGN